MQDKEAPKKRTTRKTTTPRASKALPERQLPEAPAQPTISGQQQEQIVNETF